MDKWYCPLPFRHAYIDSTGISCCCASSRQQATLDNWADHPWLKDVQQKFRDGQIPQDCVKCLDDEKQFGTSLRTTSLEDYGTEPVWDTVIDFVDYRSSNICNFKCRMCEPVFSHAIDREVKNNDILAKFYWKTETKTVSADEKNVQWIINNLQQIKRLQLTGGEPTRIPKVKEILSILLQNKKTDINILITTNASFEDEFWKTLTLEYPNLHWTVSVDAVESAAEIIRHGTNWPLVESNIVWLAANANSIDFNTVVTNLSVPGLANLLKFVRNLQTSTTKANGCTHQLHFCRWPQYMSPDNWPDYLKPQILASLSKCQSLDLDQRQKQFVDSLINMIQSTEFDEQKWKKSMEFHDALDLVRQENHRNLFDHI